MAKPQHSASRRKNTDFAFFSARSAEFSRMSGGWPSLHGGFSRRNFSRTSESDSLLESQRRYDRLLRRQPLDKPNPAILTGQNLNLDPQVIYGDFRL